MDPGQLSKLYQLDWSIRPVPLNFGSNSFKLLTAALAIASHGFPENPIRIEQEAGLGSMVQLQNSMPVLGRHESLILSSST